MGQLSAIVYNAGPDVERFRLLLSDAVLKTVHSLFYLLKLDMNDHRSYRGVLKKNGKYSNLNSLSGLKESSYFADPKNPPIDQKKNPTPIDPSRNPTSEIIYVGSAVVNNT